MSKFTDPTTKHIGPVLAKVRELKRCSVLLSPERTEKSVRTQGRPNFSKTFIVGWWESGLNFKQNLNVERPTQFLMSNVLVPGGTEAID